MGQPATLQREEESSEDEKKSVGIGLGDCVGNKDEFSWCSGSQRMSGKDLTSSKVERFGDEKSVEVWKVV